METQQSTQTPFTEREQHPVARRLATGLQEASRDAFVLGALLSVGASLTLRALGRQHDSLFVGQWAPTLLLVGLYAKRRAQLLGHEVHKPSSPPLH